MLVDMNKIRMYLSSLRISRHVYYSAVFCAGYYMAMRICDAQFSVYPFIYGFVLINILFATSLMLNNYYDSAIDDVNKKCNLLNEPGVSRPEYLSTFFFLSAASVAISLSISMPVFLTAIAIHASSWIYSSPPLRIKRFFPFNTLLIAFSTCLALVLGYFIPGGIFYRLPFTAITVFAGLLFLAFNVKDVNDCEGDKKYSVQTLMTLLGAEKGRFATAALAYSAYLLVPLLLQNRFMLVPSIILGGATFYVVMRKGKINEPIIFLLMFIYAVVFIKLIS
jgi:4-hydroxybenzoate polyprenyltransferase